MVLHLIKKPKIETQKLVELLSLLKENLMPCEQCFNISEKPICTICNSINRNKNTICVVEDFQDIIAIENTMQFNGIYHVLGGLISPIDGISPDQLAIESLTQRIQKENINEIILALNSTIEGDTTAFYIAKKVSPFSVTISTLSKGISVGLELEYADEITLGRSITNRVPYHI